MLSNSHHLMCFGFKIFISVRFGWYGPRWQIGQARAHYHINDYQDLSWDIIDYNYVPLSVMLIIQRLERIILEYEIYYFQVTISNLRNDWLFLAFLICEKLNEIRLIGSAGELVTLVRFRHLRYPKNLSNDWGDICITLKAFLIPLFQSEKWFFMQPMQPNFIDVLLCKYSEIVYIKWCRSCSFHEIKGILESRRVRQKELSN